MYNITFDASDVSLNLTDIYEGENQAHGFSVYNLFPDLPYIWPLYRMPSGRTVAGAKKTLQTDQQGAVTATSFHVDFPNCLLTEHGRVLVQIVATNSTAESVDEIFDAYAAGTFTDKIVKSRVYEFYANESIDALMEMAAPSGGISQAVKDYIEDLVDEIIEGGGSIDPAVLNTKMDKTNPTGSGAISVGRKANTTVGQNSVALGGDVEASGMDSVALGANTKANAYAAHAEGENSIASGSRSHAEGASTQAKGQASHSEGESTIAGSASQHVQGRFNIEDEDGRYAHIVGNGSSITNRSNAHTLDWRGNAWFAGDVRVGGSDYDSATPLAKATSVDLYSFNSFSVPPDTDHNILYTGNTGVTCGYFTDLPEPSQRFLEVLLDAWLGDQVLFYSSGIGPDAGEVIIETRLDPNDGETEIGYWLAINATLADTHGPKLAHFRTVDATKAVYIFSVLNDGSVEVYTSNLHGQDSVDIFVYGTTAVKEELADVAFSGDYDDLKNKPTVFPRIPFGATTSLGSNQGEIVATIDGISSLLDGVSCWLQSHTLYGGDILLSLNVNGLGPKPIYMSCNHYTQATGDDFEIMVTGLFVYNSSLGTNGGWELYAGNVEHRPTTAEMNTAIQNAVANRPTTAEMNTAIQNAIGNAIGGSY